MEPFEVSGVKIPTTSISIIKEGRNDPPLEITMNEKNKNELEETIRRLKNHMVKNSYKSQTIRAYTHFNRALCIFQNLPPSKIKTKQIQEYIDSLADRDPPYRPGSITLVISAIRKLYHDVLNRPIAYQLIAPRYRDAFHDEFTTESALNFIDSVENPKHRAIFSILYDTGLKIEDIARVFTEDVSLVKKTFTLRNVEGVVIDVYQLSVRSIRYITDHCGSCYGSYPYLFPGRSEKTYISFRTVEKSFEKATKSFDPKKHYSIMSLRRVKQHSVFTTRQKINSEGHLNIYSNRNRLG